MRAGSSHRFTTQWLPGGDGPEYAFAAFMFSACVEAFDECVMCSINGFQDRFLVSFMGGDIKDYWRCAKIAFSPR